MSCRRSEPDEWIVRANSTCLALRLPSRLSASSFARISSEFSGVRSSWDMFAMNSDLYFEAVWSWRARSSSSSEPARSSVVRRWDSTSRASVRELASIVLTLTPMASLSWSRRSRWTSVKTFSEASSITPRVSPWKRIGRMTRLTGADSPRAEETVR